MKLSTKKTPEGEFLDLAEMNALLVAENNFRSNQDEESKKQFFDAFIAFIDICTTYCNDELKGASYDKTKLAYDVFINEAKTENQYKSYLKSMLYIARDYIQDWKKFINIENIINCRALSISLLADFAWLFTEYETYFKNNEIKSGWWTRRNFDSREILWSMSYFTFMERWTDMSKISYRDIRPYSIFMVRQCLEISGKSLIGYHSIVDETGQVIKSLTQVPWEYLQMAEKKGYVSLPYPIKCIAQLNKWTNTFVHTSYFYNNFVQYFATDFMLTLFQPRKEGESLTLYNGKPAGYNFVYGDFRLTRYDEMKADFEQFIKTKTNKQFKINWLPKDNVKGYILS